MYSTFIGAEALVPMLRLGLESAVRAELSDAGALHAGARASPWKVSVPPKVSDISIDPGSMRMVSSVGLRCNLARHVSGGVYITVGTRQRVGLHTGSALAVANPFPDWVVFRRLMPYASSSSSSSLSSVGRGGTAGRSSIRDHADRMHALVTQHGASMLGEDTGGRSGKAPTSLGPGMSMSTTLGSISIGGDYGEDDEIEDGDWAQGSGSRGGSSRIWKDKDGKPDMIDWLLRDRMPARLAHSTGTGAGPGAQLTIPEGIPLMVDAQIADVGTAVRWSGGALVIGEAQRQEVAIRASIAAARVKASKQIIPRNLTTSAPASAGDGDGDGAGTEGVQPPSTMGPAPVALTACEDEVQVDPRFEDDDSDSTIDDRLKPGQIQHQHHDHDGSSNRSGVAPL